MAQPGDQQKRHQTQSQRSFGLAGIVSLNNRNALGNGESLKISSVTSYEAIFKRGENNNIRDGLQQGFNARLSLPNFSLLDKMKVKNSYQRKNTVFSLSYQFENNPNFKSILSKLYSFSLVVINHLFKNSSGKLMLCFSINR